METLPNGEIRKLHNIQVVETITPDKKRTAQIANGSSIFSEFELAKKAEE